MVGWVGWVGGREGGREADHSTGGGVGIAGLVYDHLFRSSKVATSAYSCDDMVIIMLVSQIKSAYRIR